MALIEGGHLVTRALKQENVEYLFTLCGGTIEAIYDGCIDENIGIIDVRVDQSATMMADAWARVTGKLGVSAVTRGPGHVAMLYGLATAYMADSPVLALSGNSNIEHLHQGGSQEYDQIGTVDTITKWARLVMDTHRVPEHMATAVRNCWAGRPGPVHLSLPWDVLYDNIEEKDVVMANGSSSRTTGRMKGDPDLLHDALKKLAEADRPAMVVGAGARWTEAGEVLRNFADVTNIPFFAHINQVNVIDQPHHLYYGRANSRHANASTELRHADVILALGTKFNDCLNFGGPPMFGTETQFIVVDTEPADVGWNRSFEIGILGDVQSVLDDMVEMTPSHSFQRKNAWLEQLDGARRRFRAALEEFEESNAVPVHPLRICKEVREFFGDSATISTDGGDMSHFAYMAWDHIHPPHFLFSGPIGGIGQGVPFALAGKLARPDHPSVLVTGDGSIGYGLIEFDTAFKHGLPIITVVSTDGAWGIVRHPQINRYGVERAVATDLRDLPYHKMAEAMGAYGELVVNPMDIRPALERAQEATEQGVPALINIKSQFTDSQTFLPVPS